MRDNLWLLERAMPKTTEILARRGADKPGGDAVKEIWTRPRMHALDAGNAELTLSNVDDPGIPFS